MAIGPSLSTRARDSPQGFPKGRRSRECDRPLRTGPNRRGRLRAAHDRDAAPTVPARVAALDATNASRRRCSISPVSLRYGDVPLDRAPELVDAVARQRLRRHQLRHPTGPLLHLHHRANLAPQLIRHRVIGLVHDENVGDLHDARFEHLNRVAAAWLERDERRLRELRDRHLALPDAYRFDQHDVEAEGVHQQHGVGRRAGEAAEMPAAGHRANEDGLVGEVLGQADSIAEQRAVRKRRARIDRNDADALTERRVPCERGRRRASIYRRPAVR